ncbi:MAG: DUF4105 domain-containing protein [Ferruginibacter sp.]
MKISFFKLLLFISILSASCASSYAQDSSHLRISLLTCTPGEELYSTFGHSALRVVDSSSVTDYVYNYGTFNFNDEGFYLKFIRGKLMYYISLENFKDADGYYGFESSYKLEHRGITEQVLNLSAEEKINIQHLLNKNLKEENKFYKYDFFLDNCTTRLRDIIIKSKHPNPLLPAVMPTTTTFRNAIHLYLDHNKQYWSKLGIDILLGAPTDAVMTTSQQQFLPDNLMKSLDSSKNVKIVRSSSNLYDLPQSTDNLSWFTPVVFFSLLMFLFIALGFSKNKRVQMILSGLDGFLFFMTGLLGILLIFMMTATDHSMTKNNYNILWAWPTHLIISFFINSKRKIVKKYFLIVSVCLVLLLLSWFFLPQQMSPALIPFLLLLLYRSVNKYLLIS